GSGVTAATTHNDPCSSWAGLIESGIERMSQVPGTPPRRHARSPADPGAGRSAREHAAAARSGPAGTRSDSDLLSQRVGPAFERRLALDLATLALKAVDRTPAWLTTLVARAD